MAKRSTPRRAPAWVTQQQGRGDPAAEVAALRQHVTTHMSQGNLPMALVCIQKILACQPEDVGLHNLAGICHWRMGAIHKAEICWQKALAIRPDYVEVCNNLGMLQKSMRRFTEAEITFRRAVIVKPNFVDAHYNLGLLLKELKRYPEAETSFRQALRYQPDRPDVCNALGNLYKELDRWQEAETAYRQALHLKPDHMDTLNSWAVFLQQQKQYQEAEVVYRQVLSLYPDYLLARQNLGLLYHELKRFDDACLVYQEILSRQPEDVGACNMLGTSLMELKRFDEAEAAFRQALRLEPDFVYASNNLGILLVELKRFDEAEAAYRQAVRFKPDLVDAWNNLGNLLLKHKRLDEAIVCYRKVMELQPDYPEALTSLVMQCMYCCDWQALPPLLARLDAMIENNINELNPFFLLVLSNSTKNQSDCAKAFVRKKFPTIRDLSASRSLDRHPARLRLGYLSSDFNHHPGAFVLADVLRGHDRHRFEVIGYSCGEDDGSETRQRIMAGCDRFVDVQTEADETVARRILDDGVHILLEMNGHTTRKNSLTIASFRPAPIQVSWMGYPGTLGASFIDYILFPRFLIAEGAEAHFAEKIVYLPDDVVLDDWRRSKVTLRTPSRQDYGLPAAGLLLANFNLNFKITPEVFDIWMGVMRQVPASVLWLWNDNPWAMRNLQREAAARGVDPGRLFFIPYLPYDEHLSVFRLVDLFLDNFPYNAVSTARDALWVGCPLLTCVGETCISRDAGHVLLSLGLPELVTWSLSEYADKALELARHPAQLAMLRRRLQETLQHASPFNNSRYIRNVEAAYEVMWQRWQAGLAPAPIHLPPAPGLT